MALALRGLQAAPLQKHRVGLAALLTLHNVSRGTIYSMRKAGKHRYGGPAGAEAAWAVGASDNLHCLLQGQSGWRHPVRTLRRALSRQDFAQVSGPSTLCSPLR